MLFVVNKFLRILNANTFKGSYFPVRLESLRGDGSIGFTGDCGALSRIISGVLVESAHPSNLHKLLIDVTGKFYYTLDLVKWLRPA